MALELTRRAIKSSLRPSRTWNEKILLGTSTTLSHPNTRKITLAAVFAAVYFVLRSIPTFQMIGISGRFTAADFLLTAIALIAGPRSGSLTVLIGTVLAYAVRPPIFFGLDFLPALVNISIVGLVRSNRRRISQIIYIAALLVFLMSPYSLLFGYDSIPYAWLHITALVVLLSPLAPRIPDWITRGGYHQIAAIALLALVGTMAQHLTGGLLYELAAGIVGGITPSSFKQFWQIIFWLYPTERLLIVAFSTFVATALFRSLKRLRF